MTALTNRPNRARRVSRLRTPRSALVALGAAASVAIAGHATAQGMSSAAATSAVVVGKPERVNGRANGAAIVKMLGPHAAKTLAPTSGMIGALVALPRGKTAADYGLDEVAPGIGRLRAPPARIEEFGFAHPELNLEIGPMLHPMLDRAGKWVLADVARAQRGADGRGVMVGVADTGLDVSHAEMRDANGKSRVAWMLDLSLDPLGIHPELEQRFGVKDAQEGKVTRGAVLDKKLIDALLAKLDAGTCVEKGRDRCAPSDESGHGTHVTGLAAARGAGDGKYTGIAPAADIAFVRLTRANSLAIENDNVQRAVEFMFDRADAEKRPIVVNISLGADFGPHDGSTLWEQAIAAQVGPRHPGRALVVAAGNAGSILEMPLHQSVRVTEGGTMRVPIRTHGVESGSVQVWVTLRQGANLKIGLDGPDGEWIAPVEEGHQNGRNTGDYNAGVIFGAGMADGMIPAGSRSGVVLWAGKFPGGTYSITLEGTGMAELYVEGIGDAALGSSGEAVFTNGVREGTISLPATHPDIIAVGCTVNRRRWTSIGNADVAPKVPILDPAGRLAPERSKSKDAPSTFRELTEGEVCWFSSAGPTVTGAPKPEISAPGALVFSAMSRTAKPGTPGGIFTNACPPTKTNRTDSRCYQIDDTHGVSSGTSMSSPIVAGVVALLLQKDPTLTQDKILALLQGGAHRFRGAAPFEDQAGPGEVDVMGALDALEQMKNPKLQLPAAEQSWITLSSDYVPADGSTPVTAIVELRTADAAHRADFFDKERLVPVLLVDGKPFAGKIEMVRRGPGVFFFLWTPPPGLGGSRATFGARFDGVDIVAPKTVPIATDGWNSAYPSHATGSGCAVAVTPRAGASGAGAGGAFGAALALLAIGARRRRL